MQSNENHELKVLKLEGGTREVIDAEAEAIAVPPLSTEMGDDKTTTTTAAASEGRPSSSSGLGVVVMPPPTQHEMVSLAMTEPPRPPSSAASEKDEDEPLSLQVLSARSSTPYMQAICCNNANCELGATDSTTVSPVKEQIVQLMADEKKNDPVIEEKQSEEEEEQQSLEGKKYSRSDLMNIRDEMMTIMRPECLGSTRLKRLNLGKSENGGTSGSSSNRNKHYRSSNPPNDLMPAFFKRKTATSNGNVNSITYDNFKYTDSHPFGNHNDGSSSNNHRRIGSGRLSNRDINWDYIPEEDPEKDNLPEFFNTKDTSNNGKPQRHSKKYEVDDNSNYVKRVINSVVGESSFRSGVSKNSINSSTEERYCSNSSGTSTANNKSEEPEWFSCGPTSRLDTIELCGFNESDQQQIRLELENAKNKNDANNNPEESMTNGNGGVGHKEKKHLAFQFDDFSTHGGKPGSGGGGGGVSSRMPSSKFLPLFNAKNKEEDKTVNQGTSQSLSDFLKRSDVPAVHKERLSLTEIPSVDQIEAKWRTQQQQNESKNKTNTETFRNSSENFKKMLNQLNQQQNGGVPVSSPPQQPQQSNAPSLNLFNSENLSNFIKQRNLHQQLLQKQQQQAAFAQLQLNAILSRPDTQMLLLLLARGEISKHGLVVQLANPNLNQADRDAISAVLTVSAAGQYHNQLAVNNNHQQQQQLIASQLQNLAFLQQMNKNTSTGKRNVSAGFQAATNSGGGGGGGSSMRTYSQEELQSHANYILHNAMMKKKLEEQTNLGVQKFLQLQNTVLNNAYNNNSSSNNNSRGSDSLAGSKNQHQQQQQQQVQHQPQQQHHQQRQRKSSNAGSRNPIGRRRSTSSSSSNATTVNTAQMKLAADLEFRQLEQRRNTIATTTVGADEFLQISQRI